MRLNEQKDEIIIDNGINKDLINEIKKKVNVMKKSKYRTSNFSLIEYFVNNNFQPLNQNYLISKLLEDYNANPERYVLSKNKGIFKSAKTFKQTIMRLARYNNSFEMGPGEGELSLNLKNACFYLRTVFNRYITNSRNVKTPIKLISQNKNGKNAIKKEKDFQNYNIKVNDDDNDDFFDKIINSKHSFSQKERKISNKLENEIEGNNSVISLTDSNVSTIIKVEKMNNQSIKIKKFLIFF